MIKVSCNKCGEASWRSPSKVQPRNYCSSLCYRETLVQELRERGKKFLYKEGHRKNGPEHYKKLANLLKNDGHPNWKGDKVSYRGLHQWVRRNKGKPTTCSHCTFRSSKPRKVQWANIDGKYRRVLEDFISLCVSCHKKYDLQLQSIRGGQPAIQSYSS